METLNNVAAAAAKAIMGDGNASKEPVSGVKGNVAQGEPYDAGNLETPGQQQVEKRLELEQGSQKLESTAPTTHDSTRNPLDATNITEQPKPNFEEKIEQQHAHKPSPVIGTEDKPTAITDKTEKPDNVAAPPSPKGPGPKPLADLAKEHHGDAGNRDDLPKPESDKPKSDASSGAPLGASPDSETKAAEEAYVKSTGFAAEGGDFDATKPGAGREADRLLGKDGKDSPDATKTESGSPDKHGSKSKPSLGERIKAKLHKH